MTVGMGGGSKPVPPTDAQQRLEVSQRLQQVTLDKEENRRRKRLFGAAQGLRVFAGSPLLRTRPSNTVGAPPAPEPSIFDTGGYSSGGDY